MSTARHHVVPKLLLIAAASATLAIGAAGAASATTEPPTDTAAMGTEAPADSAAPPAAGSVAADVAAFCDAAVAAVAAGQSEDPALMEPAFAALAAAAPEDIATSVDELINAQSGPGDPAFDEPYAAMIEYMGANCGFAELSVALSEYEFGGIPAEVPAGPTMLTAEAIGEEVHQIIIVRINDDVTLSLDELLALPEEESDTMVTFVGGLDGIFPGTSQSTVLDLTPGRYVAICFFPQGGMVVPASIAASTGRPAARIE